MNLYLKSYNKNNSYVYNEKELSYSILEQDNSIIPTKSSNNPISILLNRLAYNF